MIAISPGSIAVFLNGLEAGDGSQCEAPIIEFDAFYTDPQVLGFHAIEEDEGDILCL